MPDTSVADPPAPPNPAPEPAPTPPPESKTRGDKFRAAMPKEKVETKPQVTPPPAKADAAKAKDATPPTDKTTSPLDIALGDVKPPQPAPPPEDDISKTITELDGVKEPKSEHWERARGVMKKQSERITSLTPEIDRLKTELGKVDPKVGETLASTTKELETTRADNAKLREAITALNVEFDPEYQEKYVAGRQKLLDRALSRVKEYGGNVDQFTDALSLNGKARTQALKESLSEVDDIDRPRIVSILDQIQSLDDERSDLRKDPRQAFEQLTARRQKEQEQFDSQFESARKTEFDKIVSSLPEKSPMFRQVEGATDWNDPIKESIGTAEKILGKDVDYSQVVEVALKGARYDAVEKMLIDTRKELKNANSRIAEFENALPNLPGTHRKAPEGDDKRTPGQKYEDAMAKTRSGGDGDV